MVSLLIAATRIIRRRGDVRADGIVASKTAEMKDRYPTGDANLSTLRAALANVVPGLIVQTLMLAMLLAYYFSQPATIGTPSSHGWPLPGACGSRW